MKIHAKSTAYQSNDGLAYHLFLAYHKVSAYTDHLYYYYKWGYASLFAAADLYFTRQYNVISVN